MITSLTLYCILFFKGPVFPQVKCIDDPVKAGEFSGTLKAFGYQVETYEVIMSKGLNTRLEEFKSTTIERLQ